MNLARLILSSLFIATMIWLWYPYISTNDQVVEVDPTLAVCSDYSATELKQTIFDQQGNISHKVTAKAMVLCQELDYTHFTKPSFILYSDKATWKISAEEATLYGNNKLILEQDVVAVNLNLAAIVQKVTTEQIEVHIDKSTMHTDELVTMAGPNLLVTGKGLNANLLQEQLKLINHTETIYYAQ